VKEKPPQGIYGTGGTFGAEGGYLGVFYTVFNLLGLGEKLSLQADGGAASSNLLLNLAGQHFLGSPFTIGLSVFHKYSGVNVASIVPDASDLVHLLTDRRKGVRLAGSYSIGSRAQAGIGLQIERATTEFGDGNRSAHRWTSEISTGLDYDTASPVGVSAHGYRFSSSAAVSSRALMGSIESVSGSAHLTRFLSDPWTGGRNSLALNLNVAAIRSAWAGGIAPEKRLYPGGEILRGFRRGELGSWAVGKDGSAGGLKPIGADTFASTTVEYRVPVNGPLSAVAFCDLGWSRLDPAVVAEPGLRLIDATNALVRASTGGELRVELPVINQPARLIFAWNPFRLNRILHESTSTVRIADRRGLVRFALGGVN
jgi:outer membrane protein assembly factor BamA